MNAPIALGFGNCIDYEIVWDAAVMAALITDYAIRADELTLHRAINSERDLVISILSFLQAGIGGERWVASSAIVEQFSQRFARKITLGGTSVRAAIAMRKLGYTSALHLVTINEHVRHLIPADSPYVCSNPQESAYPHLIVQFDQGTRVRAGEIDLCTQRANRLIYHNDSDNISMPLNRDFAGLIAAAQVLLISGFNAMQSEALLCERLATLVEIMAALPHDAVVFYEDAGFYNPAFHQLIQQQLAGRITIFSLNEDELQGHLGRPLDLLDAAQVRAALADLQQQLPVPLLVVHTKDWALAYGAGAPALAAALKGGVTMATTRFRYGDDFTVADYEATAALSPNEAGAAFATAIEQLLGDQLCCVPVAQVAQANGITIGLGDAFVGGFLPALLR
ncbi:MAG: ADP-dependent glucokinase/phosphofructokinase [Caldilineaceae bacterium]